MQPFDDSNSKSILIIDNCSIHHVGPVKELMQDAGILHMFLPPYSPDFNPIEETFSSLKYYLECFAYGFHCIVLRCSVVVLVYMQDLQEGRLIADETFS